MRNTPLARKTELKRTSELARKPFEPKPGRRKAPKPSRPKPVPGYDYLTFGEGVLALDGPGCFVRRLLGARGADDALLRCDWPLDAHHCLHKRWLKDNFHGGHGGRSLGALLSDPANGVLACNRHHHLAFHRRLVEVGHDDLPDRVHRFAEELGDRAVLRLELDYPLAIRERERA